MTGTRQIRITVKVSKFLFIHSFTLDRSLWHYGHEIPNIFPQRFLFFILFVDKTRDQIWSALGVVNPKVQEKCVLWNTHTFKVRPPRTDSSIKRSTLWPIPSITLVFEMYTHKYCCIWITNTLIRYRQAAVCGAGSCFGYKDCWRQQRL